MKLNKNLFDHRDEWEQAGISIPAFDYDAVCCKTAEEPEWLHFGAGNIFRGFIADVQQDLLNRGLVKTGIIACDTFDFEIIDKIYKPFDNLTLLALMKADGSVEKKVVASITESLHADSSNNEYWNRLKKIFCAQSLKMITFTITEKGYALNGIDGSLMSVVQSDIDNGPSKPVHAMSVVTALLLERYNASSPVAQMGLAVVSMDNCSHNGEKLQSAILTIAQKWIEKGFADAEFLAYLKDESKITFPWSMIDKITPRPAENIQQRLEALGVENMLPIVTNRKTFIAPFVNAEVPCYLVIEDAFPVGRPPLEKVGVYLTTREIVNKTETMKVTTCLNPLHTALAVYGCILGYTSIAAEMQNPQLVALVKKIGYDEGLPVVVHPGILEPKAFIDEVINERFSNPSIPDTPQRIACDTSQKIPVRFGETIKAYIKAQKDLTSLIGIPLALAGWLRYLLAIDDDGKTFKLNSDPMLEELQNMLSIIEFGKSETVKDTLRAVLSNEVLFGVNLYDTCLAQKIEGLFAELIAGSGAVQKTLEKYLS